LSTGLVESKRLFKWIEEQEEGFKVMQSGLGGSIQELVQ